MSMEYRISSFNAAIDMDDDDFMIISECETFNAMRYKDRPEDLEQKLGRLPGVSDIEYNGHFGPSIFFRLDCEETDSVGPLAIAQTIKDHIKECKKFLKRNGLLKKKREA